MRLLCASHATPLAFDALHCACNAEARQIYEAAILEWTDAYNDSLQGTASPQALHAKRAIAQLWMEYARMERSLRQWKQAVTVFENALADETVNDLVDVWIEYANFYDKYVANTGECAGGCPVLLNVLLMFPASGKSLPKLKRSTFARLALCQRTSDLGYGTRSCSRCGSRRLI